MRHIAFIIKMIIVAFLMGCTSHQETISKPPVPDIQLSETLVNELRSLKGVPEEITSQYIYLRSKLEREFYDSRYLSNTNAYWQGQAGQQIISMGKAALPFIMLEIEYGNFFFNVPARKITGLSMRRENEFASEQEYAKRWANWWQINKNNPEWNIYVEHSNEGESADVQQK